jgi:hypothetical protein
MRSALRSAFEQCFDNIEADHINYLREEVGGVIRIHVINMKREREREREREIMQGRLSFLHLILERGFILQYFRSLRP